jgi:hypothetical protein
MPIPFGSESRIMFGGFHRADLPTDNEAATEQQLDGQTLRRLVLLWALPPTRRPPQPCTRFCRMARAMRSEPCQAPCCSLPPSLWSWSRQDHVELPAQVMNHVTTGRYM